MSEEVKKKVMFEVRYKSNGVDATPYHHSPIKPGRSGRFTCDDADEEGAPDQAEKDAKACLAKVKKFFNERTTVTVETEDENGDPLEKAKEVKTITVKEVVHVWIDRYENGVRVYNGDPTCVPPSESKADETKKPASSSQPKSTSSTKEMVSSK